MFEWSDISDLSISSSDDDSEVPPRRRRVIRPRMNPYHHYGEEEFRARYRLSKDVISELLSKIGPNLEPQRHGSVVISALEQVLLTISFYATGAFQITVADHIRVHKSTACRIIKKVSALIAGLRPQYINMPQTQEQIDAAVSGFYDISGFPHVVGALDCTHIKVQSPGGNQAERFRNRKGYFSINTQAICNAKLKIMDVIARWPGSVHDTTILNDSHIRANFELGIYGHNYLLGDSGYPCRSYLLTPFINPATPSQEAYNKSHIKTRNTVERCFGVLKRRFPCLSMGLRVKLETTMHIIVACCVLHNIAIECNDLYDEDDIDNNEVPLPRTIDPSSTSSNTAVRSSLLLTHFNVQ